jgi:hypothetical protein
LPVARTPGVLQCRAALLVDAPFGDPRLSHRDTGHAECQDATAPGQLDRCEAKAATSAALLSVALIEGVALLAKWCWACWYAQRGRFHGAQGPRRWDEVLKTVRTQGLAEHSLPSIASQSNPQVEEEGRDAVRLDPTHDSTFREMASRVRRSPSRLSATALVWSAGDVDPQAVRPQNRRFGQ